MLGHVSLPGTQSGMPEIHVFPHGSRWAVQPDDAESPIAEFATQEEAELEARRHAGETGASVRVTTSDPTGLTEAPGDTPVGDGAGGDTDAFPNPVRPGEQAREPQAGL